MRVLSHSEPFMGMFSSGRWSGICVYVKNGAWGCILRTNSPVWPLVILSVRKTPIIIIPRHIPPTDRPTYRVYKYTLGQVRSFRAVGWVLCG